MSLKHETLLNLIKENTPTWKGKGRNSKRGASSIQKCIMGLLKRIVEPPKGGQKNNLCHKLSFIT
jgi:hypothetical protein